MDFKRTWTRFAVEAEYDHFGVARIVKAHNEQIATLQSQLAASQKRERILREGLEKYSDTGNWAYTEMNTPYRNLWMRWERGYDVATATLKAAEEVK